ncbi:hypothetical protein K2P56_00910 [Patescibacteria group bacterium]|nr:hypothetical protein [Patescibacteria group bacterium]
MKRESVIVIKPELYAQLPNQAWLNRDKTIGVEFAGQKWIVEGDAGTQVPTHITEKAIVDIYGVPMSLVSIRRLARVVIDKKEEIVPILRYSQCRLPINVVRQMGAWSKPGPARGRYRA